MSLLKVNSVTDLGGDAPTIPPYAGQILQVVQATKTDTFTTTSTSFVDITGFSATITPSSVSSKIIIMMQFGSLGATAAEAAHIQLFGGNTSTFIGDAASNRVRATTTSSRMEGVNGGFNQHGVPITFLDSPATVSAVTYGARMRVSAGTGAFNRSSGDNDSTNQARTASSIILMEVAG
jgi:hypothetical protein